MNRLDTIYRLRQAATLLSLVDVPAPASVNLHPSGGIGFAWQVEDEAAAEAVKASLTRWGLRWSVHRYDSPDRNCDLILSGWDYDDADVSAMISVPVAESMAVAS